MTRREALARALEASRLCARPWQDLPPGVRDAELRRADAILATLDAAGWTVAPTEAQPAQIAAAIRRFEGPHRERGAEPIYAGIYRAMLAAAKGSGNG